MILYQNPFLKKELETGSEFDKNFDPHLKQEIHCLQKKTIQHKSKKDSIAESESKTGKCENNNCQHEFSVTVKNVAAYGCCGHCKESFTSIYSPSCYLHSYDYSNFLRIWILITAWQHPRCSKTPKHEISNCRPSPIPIHSPPS